MSMNNLDKQRQLTAHVLQDACQLLDNKTTCNLLEKQLHKYSDLFANELGNYKSKVEKVLSQKNCPIKKTSFDIASDITDLLKPLHCSNSINCKKSEDVSDTEFKDFIQLFNNCNDKPFINNSGGNNRFENKNQQIGVRDKFDNVKNQGVKDAVVRKKTSKYPVSFKTARDELQLQNAKKNNGGSNFQQSSNSTGNNLGAKKKLGLRRNINSKFVSPLLSNTDSSEDIKNEVEWGSDVDERLKNVEPKMVELIRSEIMDCGPGITWDDIAGLEFAKTAIQEAVVWPMLRPDIFTGLRRPPKGILLFGPPGTGKTLIGKCVASQSKSTFFSISASSLTSKWVGDGEKMVRALFVVARVHQPAVIFIDEIDSLLSQRSDNEHESSRRIKTEFLVQLDGATTESEERILVIGATNRPQELDEAARRRFVKRLYIPLPDYKARLQLVQKLILQERHELKLDDFEAIATKSDGYSGADIRTLCSEASLGPIRSIDISLIEKIEAAQVRPLIMDDFEKAFLRVRSSVSSNDLDQYIVWDNTYGSGSCH